MKKKFLAALAGGILVIGMAGVASAVTINYLSTDSAADKTSLYTYIDNFLIETFNGVTPDADVASASGLDQPSWTWTGSPTGSGTVVDGFVTNVYAAPFGLTQPDQTPYLTVDPVQPNNVTVDLGSEYDYFGLWWGSVDDYNTISFFNGTTLVDSFSGLQATEPGPANGNQGAQDTNIYVNFLNLDKFDSVMFTTTGYAFEFDNIAVGLTPIPEPATMLLFGTGLLGLAGFSARRRKK